MPWTPELWTYKGDLAGAKYDLDRQIEKLLHRTRCTHLKVALSDMRANFRKDVASEYKSNRIHVVRPVLFAALRDVLRNKYQALVLPRLEGDDLLSMWATEPGADTVVCSIDKDCRTIPGMLYNPVKDTFMDVTHAEAERFFISQVLTGDRVDGYAGCPGIGPKRAAALMEGVDTAALWKEVVLPAYRAADLTESTALRNARCARLLRHGEYNHETGEITLWEP